ncbi:opioid growth factor receptor-like isoform X2 [Enoplosus armatus]|uniref:opioid growth factor receptor-like isoform X2 n=1 Tax=Enoplosus armatus TaxID=215367 RepID=UPI003993341C
MRAVSALCRLGRYVVLLMAWFSSSRLYPVFEWLWRKLGSLWRCIASVFRPLVGYVRLAIGWRQDHGGRDEPQIIGEEPERSSPQDLVSVGPQEAAGAKRALPNEGASSEEEGDEHDDDDEFNREEYRVETSDELYCGYDSTWETEEHQESAFRGARRPAASRHYKFIRFESAARDMQNYRHDYPSQMRPQRWKKPVSVDMPNLNFYLGYTYSVPDGVYIHDFHSKWFGDYEALEYVHSYIQWLFPLQEPGMNDEASPLTKEEIKGFLENRTAQENLLNSYKLMLDFYGIELCNEETGEVRRASNWRERFHNLNSHTHNNLRITRILKCQGTLGYPHYQAPLVRFFLEETLVHGELPNVKDSVLNYFVFAVLDKRQRRSLIKFAFLNYDRKDEFVWCPKKIQTIWSRAVSVQAAKGNDWSVGQ